jgi:hypothetical protein
MITRGQAAVEHHSYLNKMNDVPLVCVYIYGADMSFLKVYEKKSHT